MGELTRLSRAIYFLCSSLEIPEISKYNELDADKQNNTPGNLSSNIARWIQTTGTFLYKLSFSLINNYKTNSDD